MLTKSQQDELRTHYNPKGSNIRNLQLNLLSILTEFDEFARKNKLTYSISYGTLIGAIRHHGFIPWDDDEETYTTGWLYNRCYKYKGNSASRIAYGK